MIARKQHVTSHFRGIDKTNNANIGRKFPKDSELTGSSEALKRLAQALEQLVPFVSWEFIPCSFHPQPALPWTVEQ